MSVPTLLVGNQTGHHDQYSITYTDGDGFILRGHGSLRKARELAHLLRRGAQATGTDLKVSIPDRQE